MVRYRGKVISLALFIILGILVGSFLASGGPAEQTGTYDGSFEGADNGDFEGSGTLSANVVVGVYTPDGEPVEVKRLGASLLPWMYTNGGGGTDPTTGKQITDYWQGTVSQITVTGKNIDPDSISVLVRWLWDSPQGVKVLQERPLGAGRFTVDGDAHAFTATSTWSDTFKGQLQTIASNEGINVQVSTFHWKFRVRVSCAGQEMGSVRKIQATAKEATQEFDTTYSATPTYGTGTLLLDANVGTYVDPNYHSILANTVGGVFIQFVTIVLFVGLWYYTRHLYAF